MDMSEAIAVVGLDLKFPGDASTPESFYEMLQSGRSALSDVPSDRYNLDAFYHPDQERAGTFNVKKAHFVKENIAAFDAPFFSITPAEAACMDPQQRGLLESVYRALENSGIPMSKALGSNTSVHVGCFTREYDSVISRDPEVDLKYIATGTGTAMLSNRLSWFFDFRGPSLSLDTACSSSLNAAHLACQSLRLGEVSMAIIGGCNLFYNPDTVIPLTSLGFLSPEGKCYSFDHRANGYSRGEGFGIMVLKRVSDAIRDNDTIRAVIRNTVSNQDGKSPGITQPTKSAQVDLIRQAYKSVGLDPGSTRYFEAHGTGTPVGDPIEASAISSVFTKYRSPQDPMYIGALKSNIGHLEGAAGIAGLLKSVFVLERGIIPPNCWFEKPNPKIPVDDWNFKFPTTATLWPNQGLRRASINAFGYGGSNAHVIMEDALSYLSMNKLNGKHRTVESPKLDLDLIHGRVENGDQGNYDEQNIIEFVNTALKAMGAIAAAEVLEGLANPMKMKRAPETIETRVNEPSNGTNGTHESDGTQHINLENAGNNILPAVQLNGNHHLEASLDRKERVFTLSSFDEAGTQRLAQTYHEHLLAKSSKIEDKSTYLDDLSYTLFSKRTSFPWRTSIVADSIGSLIKALEGRHKPLRSGTSTRVGFVFTGQGAQWYAMGRELLAYQVFNESLVEASQFLKKLGCNWILMDEYLKNEVESSINDPQFSQPICTALQVALVELLASWSVHPGAVVGHSSGEIAAAFAVGAISRETAWKLSYYRGALSSALARSKKQSRGAMLSIALSSKQAQSYLEKAEKSSGEGTITIACINSPKNVTVSGCLEGVDALKGILDREGIFARKLQVDNAYHSTYMKAIANDYKRMMGDLEPGKSVGSSEELPFYSSVTGSLTSPRDLQAPDYWINNLISPVQFLESVTRMFTDTAPKVKKLGARKTSAPITELLEIGPHGALRGPIREIMEQLPDSNRVGYETLLKRGSSATQTSLAAAGWLYCRGHNVDISKINEGSTKQVSPNLLVDLPSYPFNHSKSYWNESRISKGYRFRKHARHELLGAPVPDWDVNNAVWRNWIRVTESPWVKDHRVTGSTLYPAAGMLVMAIEASRQLASSEKKLKGFRFKEVVLHMALRIPLNAEGVETHFHLRPYLDSTATTSSSWSEFELRSCEGGDWRGHCRGLIQTEYEAPHTPVDDGLEDRMFAEICANRVAEAERTCRKDVSTKQLYELLQTVGLDFGPTFQNLSEMRIDQSRNAVATVKAPDIKSKMPHGYVQPHLIHPTTLDGVLQSILVALTRGGREVREVMVPTSIKELWISADLSATHQSHRLCANADFLGLRQAEASFVAIDTATRKPLVSAEGFVSTAVSGRDASQEDSYRHLCFNIDWKLDPSFVDQEIATRTFVAPHELTDFDPSDLITDIEMMCYIFIKRYSKGNPHISLEQMKPHHRKYIAWMHHQFERHDRGELLHAKSDWNKLAEDDHFVAELERRLETASAEATLSVAVGRVLPQILSGEIDPLQILFNDQLAENVYRHGTGAEISYAKLAGYLDALAHKNPDMRILEVGAGTGGATSPIFDTLMHHGEGEAGAARFSTYDFTDISPSFFEKAKETFHASADRMNFRTLNIENDPAHQGFDVEQYDLIIGANVLHATKSIDVTLQNCRKLLKPGGKLMLYELTGTTKVRTGFGFGLLPGWWLSNEPHRKWGPLMSVPTWSTHLQRTGFTGVDISFDDYPDSDANQLNSVIISTATFDPPKARKLLAMVIMIDEKSILQRDLAEQLRSTIDDKKLCKCEIVPLHQLQATSFDQKSCIFLPELETSFLDRVHEDDYKGLQKMTGKASNILWLTQGGGPSSKNPRAELVTGFARTIRAENPTLKFITLSFETVRSAATACATTIKIFDAIFAKDDKRIIDNSFYESDGKIHISRIIEANYMNTAISTKTREPKAQSAPFGKDPERGLKVLVGSPGLLDTLQFDDDPVYDQPLMEGQVEFKVKASALNFLDIMVALGQVIGNQMGVEGAGVVTRTGPNSKFKIGDRICGIVRGTLKTYARGMQNTVTKIPDDLPWVSAASLPVVFITAWCALYDIADIQKGETVLIHAAAGGVGQACIQIAQLRGAEVYATVGTIEKRNLLEETYGIPRDHIFSSRDLTFASGIKRMTKNRGVDVIVNALSGAGLRATWECIAPFGRFVEIGKVDIYSSARLNMEMFKKNVSFEFIDVGYMADNDGPRFERILEAVMGLVREGKLRELNPVQVYPFAKIQEAFRYMQSGAHSGKVVLVPHEDDEVMIVPSRKPTYNFDPNATYVISGGLGGLGRSMAQWMANRGAKNLILLSRSGATRDSAKELVEDLEAANVKVATPPCDVSDLESLTQVIHDCLTDMPPVKGCIQGSMVLKDAIFANMSIEDYHTAVRPKVQASWNLHNVLPKQLEFFILLSSGSGIVGNRGQANYVVGNTFQDALARHRVSLGLKATALDLGMILSVGFTAEKADVMSHLRAAGFAAMREEEYHAMLDELCNPHLEPSSLLKAQVALGFEIPETLRSKGIEDPGWMHDPLFKHLYQIRTVGGSGDSAEDSVNYGLLLAAADSHQAAVEIINDAIVRKLCKALTIEAQDVDSSKPLHEHGVDSLVAVELRTWLLKDLGAEVAVFDMMSGSSIRALAGLAAGRSSLVKVTEAKD